MESVFVVSGSEGAGREVGGGGWSCVCGGFDDIGKICVPKHIR